MIAFTRNFNAYKWWIFLAIWAALLVLVALYFDGLQWLLFSLIGLLGTGFVLIYLPPWKLLNLFIAITFVIYIPVSFFRSILPLLVLDLFVILLFLLTILKKGISKERIFGGSISVLLLILLYLLSLLLGLFSDNIVSMQTALQGFRTHIFGIFFLFLSSIWLKSAHRVDEFIKVFLFGAIFVALYGLRQYFFGFFSFELERLATAGSALMEFELLGRARIPSTFGQPTPFSFVMMISILIFPIARFRQTFPIIFHRGYYVFLALLFVGLVISLMRGPFIAFLVAVTFLLLISSSRLIKKYL
jgi:hypothetical protein